MKDIKIYRSLQRQHVARDIASFYSDYPYGNILTILEEWNVFNDWSIYELNNRPVDLEALAECINDFMEV